jgi:hypothetical protein
MLNANAGRRKFLRAGAAAGSLLLPVPYAWVWAQSEGALKLLKLPKLALVLGNSKYQEAPLRNPANDASAMADTLKASGFDVTLRMDANKADMAAAVQAYVQMLAAKQCVGLFYYAGHGIQLAWRNYMVPVDASLGSTEDVQTQGVDVGDLLRGLTKAANPMNVIILDACRDNPFGSLKSATQRGLAQMDAPPNTLLAFATAPGNVASDGEGANGLYTENLLRQMTVPEAKIEDVFKRVRLDVRKRSNGAQIPWESTSLEEDFWFQPPKELKRLSDEQKAAEFAEELAGWDRIKDSPNADDFYAYLQKYPTGLIAEQAQFRLDQLQKPKVEAAPGADGIKPLASGTNRYVVGDRYVYEEVDRLKSGAVRRYTSRVVLATDDRVEFAGGNLVLDQMGNILQNRTGIKKPGLLKAPADIALGKRWRTAYTNTRPDGEAVASYWDFRVVALEEIQVPAGSFRAFKIEGNGADKFIGRRTPLDGELASRQSFWIDPLTMIELRGEQELRDGKGKITYHVYRELVSYERAPR